MKNVVKIIAVTVLLCFSCTTQMGTNPDTAPGKGSIIVREKNGFAAKVFLDGRLMHGTTPLTINNVNVGTHTLQLYYPNYSSSPIVNTVVVNEGKYSESLIELSKASSGSIEITTEPLGIVIAVDNAEYGKTPLKIDGLPAGKHVISSRYSNYRVSDTVIEVGSGELKNVTLKPVLKKTSFLEYFSNTDCIGCPKMGAAIESFLHEYQDISPFVEFCTFHFAWPSNADPFYAAFQAEQDQRDKLYDVKSLPDAYLNGDSVVWNENEKILHDTLKSMLSTVLSKEPLLGMYFSNLENDTQNVSGALNIVFKNSSPSNNLFLSIAIVEEYIRYPVAPGSNGQKEFYSIFRGYLKDFNNTAVSIDNSSTVSFKGDISNYWKSDLRLVAFIHSKDDKRILQTVSIKL